MLCLSDARASAIAIFIFLDNAVMHVRQNIWLHGKKIAVFVTLFDTYKQIVVMDVNCIQWDSRFKTNKRNQCLFYSCFVHGVICLCFLGWRGVFRQGVAFLCENFNSTNKVTKGSSEVLNRQPIQWPKRERTKGKQ